MKKKISPLSTSTEEDCLFLKKHFRKSGEKTDTVNSRGKLPAVYERAKRQPLTDLHPAACSVTIFRVSVGLYPCGFTAKIP